MTETVAAAGERHSRSAPARHGTRPEVSSMIAGIDLASAPANTGVALLRCENTLANPARNASHSPATERAAVVVERLAVGADDADLLQVIRSADHTGIDVPIGWPRGFVTLISEHQSAGENSSAPSGARPGGPDAGSGTEVGSGMDVGSGTGVGSGADAGSATEAGRGTTDESWRSTAILRTTDRELHARTGLRPLSVSSDRIAYPALRWAALEQTLRAEGMDCSRDGSGRISEVYPAGALQAWNLPHRGYKGTAGAGVREQIITRLMELLPWLDWNRTEDLCLRNDNALDALLAALSAREVRLGAVPPPPPQLRADALAEGWIMTPITRPNPPGARAQHRKSSEDTTP